jgi:hypothetical protein
MQEAEAFRVWDVGGGREGRSMVALELLLLGKDQLTQISGL